MAQDTLSTITECTRTGADCDCCGHYDEYTIDLSCGHQIVQNDREIRGEKARCPECSGDYEDIK